MIQPKPEKKHWAAFLKYTIDEHRQDNPNDLRSDRVLPHAPVNPYLAVRLSPVFLRSPV